MLLLDNSKLDLRRADLPCLIHGVEGSGASLFSVTLIAEQYYLHGSKILFFSAKPEAKEEFLKQVGEQEPFNTDKQSLSKATTNRAVFVNSSDQDSFVNVVKKLPDLDERVIFIKNIEEYDEKVFEVIRDKQNLIISGDIDKCAFKDKILQKEFVTRIYFSQPQFNTNITFPYLNKYQGYLVGKNKNGIVQISQNHEYIEGYTEPEVYVQIGGKAVVLNNEGEILLLQRSEKSGRGGGWDFPGGGIDFGEDPIRAVKREIHEEAGLKVTEVKPIYIESSVKENDRMFIGVGYKTQALSENVQLSWEHDSYKWVTKAEAMEMDLPNFFKKCIESL